MLTDPGLRTAYSNTKQYSMRKASQILPQFPLYLQTQGPCTAAGWRGFSSLVRRQKVEAGNETDMLPEHSGFPAGGTLLKITKFLGTEVLFFSYLIFITCSIGFMFAFYSGNQ